MKIIIDGRGLSTNYENRGIGYYIKNLITYIPKFALEINFVIFIGNKNSIQYIPSAKNISYRIIKRSWKRRWLEDIIKLPKEIKKENANLYHCPTALGPIRDIGLPLFTATPTISTIHDMHVENLNSSIMKSYRKELRYKLQRYAVKKSSIITVSNYSKKSIIKAEISNNKNIIVIPNTINIQDDNNTIKEDIILFIGDSKHKNIEGAINTFYNCSKNSKKWKYIIVGKKDNVINENNRKINELISSKKLSIKEDISSKELSEIFKKSKILFMPSISEGFGIPIIEAFANKVAVITSKKSSLPEIALDAALYVNHNDIKDMTTTLEKLMNNNNLQKELISNGLKRVKDFSIEANIPKLIETYKKAISHD